MGSAFHQLCPRYSGTLTPTAPTAIRLWETFTFYTFVSTFYIVFSNNLLYEYCLIAILGYRFEKKTLAFFGTPFIYDIMFRNICKYTHVYTNRIKFKLMNFIFIKM